MIGFDEAARLVAAAARPLGTERVPLDQAHGRVLAEPIVAHIAAPGSDVSIMDGYAVRAADLVPLPARLRVVGEAYPGHPSAVAVASGTAVRIFTGAALPAGADRVVIQEHVRREEAWALVEEAGSGSNVRRAGSDFARGDTLVQADALLTPGALVAAAAADLAQLTVWRRPRIRVIATGDELAAPGDARDRDHAIPDSISPGLAALATLWGGAPIGSIILRDDLPAMRAQADAVSADADLLVLTGGASVGERDFAKAMFGDALELIFSKVAIKPGKPVWFGRLGERLVMGLPGNPTSAIVTARLLLAPLLAGLSGRAPASAWRWRMIPIAEDLPMPGDRETFARAFWRDDRAALLPNQDSGAQKMLAATALLVRRPVGRAFAAGEAVAALDF